MTHKRRQLREKIIFVLGNPLVEEDNIAIKTAKKLREMFPKLSFEMVESVDSITELPKKLVLLDAVSGVKNAELIADLDRLQGSDVFSLHDLDSGFQLKLFKKMGKIKQAKIIAVPQQMGEENAVEAVALLLKQKEKELF